MWTSGLSATYKHAANALLKCPHRLSLQLPFVVTTNLLGKMCFIIKTWNRYRQWVHPRLRGGAVRNAQSDAPVDRQEMWRSTSDGSRLTSLECFRVNNYRRCYASQVARTEIPVKTKLQLKTKRKACKMVKIMLLFICCMIVQFYTLTAPSFRACCSEQNIQLLENKTDQGAHFVLFLWIQRCFFSPSSLLKSYGA
jgi:hypothetical protein